MASIGPALPPHLQKRKRGSEADNETPGSPPSKIKRGGNQDEIALSDSSEDDMGPMPARPSSSLARNGPAPPRPAIGPSPHPGANDDEIDLDDSDEDGGIGPTAPSASKSAPSPPIIGPTMPPGSLDDAPDDLSDSDSDDDYGPALPSATASGGSSSLASGPAMPAAHAPEPAAKRDDWMLAPPSDSGPRAQDPTKIKARGFASGRAAGSRGSGEISSIWTETPEEKARRLRDAVLGRADVTASQETAPKRPGGEDAGRRKKKKGPDSQRIQSFTEQTRGKSLYDEHQAKQRSSEDAAAKKAAEEDDPSKRAFDKEKDMAIGGRINNSQRREMLNRAANYGGRFQKGDYL